MTREPWLKQAILSALSSDPPSTPILLPSQIFLLQCSAAKGPPIAPVHAFLSDKYTHIRAVITVSAGRLFCERHEQHGISMLSQSLIALKQYTLMLKQPAKGEVLPQLLILVEEFNFLSPADNFPKTALLDDDEEVAAKLRYVYHDFFKEPRPAPYNNNNVVKLDPALIQLLVKNADKSAIVPGWSHISRPIGDDDKDDDSICSGPVKDRTTLSQSARPVKKSTVQFLSPEKHVASGPIKSPITPATFEKTISESSQREDIKKEISEISADLHPGNNIETVPILDADGGENEPKPTVEGGPNELSSLKPQIEIVDCTESDNYLNGFPIEVLSSEFPPGLTQFGFGSDDDEFDHRTPLVEIPIVIDLVDGSDQDDDTASFKATVKKEDVSPIIAPVDFNCCPEAINDIAKPDQIIVFEVPAAISLQRTEPQSELKRVKKANAHSKESERSTEQKEESHSKRSESTTISLSDPLFRTSESTSLHIEVDHSKTSDLTAMQTDNVDSNKSESATLLKDDIGAKPPEQTTVQKMEGDSKKSECVTVPADETGSNRPDSMSSRKAGEFHLKKSGTATDYRPNISESATIVRKTAFPSNKSDSTIVQKSDVYCQPTTLQNPDSRSMNQESATMQSVKGRSMRPGTTSNGSRFQGDQKDLVIDFEQVMKSLKANLFFDKIETYFTKRHDDRSGCKKTSLEKNASIQTRKRSRNVDSIKKTVEAPIPVSEIAETQLGLSPKSSSMAPHKKMKTASSSDDIFRKNVGQNLEDSLEKSDQDKRTCSGSNILNSRDLLLFTLKDSAIRFKRRRR